MQWLNAAGEFVATLYEKYPTRLPLAVILLALLVLSAALCFEKRSSAAVVVMVGMVVTFIAAAWVLLVRPDLLRI